MLIRLVRNDWGYEQMTLLLIIPAWVLLLGLVVGLCTAARIGDTLDSREPGVSAAPQTARSRAEDRVAPTRQAGAHGGHMPARNIAA
jgi:hypothetical protein